MLNKQNIIKSIGHLSNGRVVFDKRLTHPVRDWLLGLLLFTFVVAGGVIQSSHMFVSYRNITASNNADEVLKVRYNQKLVQNTLAIYRNRALVLGEFKNTATIQISTIEPVQATSTSSDTSATEEATSTSSIQLSN